MRNLIFVLLSSLSVAVTLFTATAVASTTPTTTAAQSTKANWPGYPDSLPAYEYPGTQLAEHWTELTALIHIPYPDAGWIEETLNTHPALQAAMAAAARDPATDKSLIAASQGNYQPLAEQLQQVWRLHYGGHYEQAWRLGNQLGPLGEIPANYARLINASFILTDKSAKLAEFRACAESSQASLQLAPDYALSEYGLVYARVRILELLDNTQARSSGYIDFAQKSLASLARNFPQEPVYKVTQGGLEAGIVARIGSFLATLTYGVSEDSAVSAFNSALQVPKARKPTVLHEFATAMKRMSADNYRDSIRQLRSLCANADVASAEEALVQQQCRAELQI